MEKEHYLSLITIKRTLENNTPIIPKHVLDSVMSRLNNILSEETVTEIEDFVPIKEEDLFDNTEKSSIKMDKDEDKVNHPSHYQSYGDKDIECIDALEAAFGPNAVAYFCICNAFKYVWRHMSKNGKTDISKAIWYLNKYLELDK